MSPPHTEHPSSHAHLGSALASEPKSGYVPLGKVTRPFSPFPSGLPRCVARSILDVTTEETSRSGAPRARDDVAALARVRATYRVAAAPGREIRHRVHPRSRALIQNLVPRRPRVLGARRHRRAAARGDGGVKRHRRRRGALPLHRRLRQRGVAVLLAVRERADGLPDRVRRGRRRRRRCDTRRAPSPLPLPAAARLVPPRARTAPSRTPPSPPRPRARSAPAPAWATTPSSPRASRRPRGSSPRPCPAASASPSAPP